MHHYKSVGRHLTIENEKYEIVKSYNDHSILVKTAKKDQHMKLAKVQKNIIQLHWIQSADTFMNTFIGHHGAPLASVLKKILFQLV